VHSVTRGYNRRNDIPAKPLSSQVANNVLSCFSPGVLVMCMGEFVLKGTPRYLGEITFLCQLCKRLINDVLCYPFLKQGISNAESTPLLVFQGRTCKGIGEIIVIEIAEFFDAGECPGYGERRKFLFFQFPLNFSAATGAIREKVKGSFFSPLNLIFFRLWVHLFFL